MTGEPCRPDEPRTLVAAILAAAWRATSAVTSAPREQAGAAGRIIECHNTPHSGAVTRNGLVKVSSVASKLTTVSAQDMIKAMIAGQRDPRKLAAGLPW